MVRIEIGGVVALGTALGWACAAHADPPPVAATRVLWLRADAGVNNTANGGEVTAWQDTSPGGMTFTAPAGNGPRYFSSQGNCALPALRFSIGNNRLSGNLGAGLTDATVFALARYPTSSPNNYVYTIGASGSAGSQMTLSRRNGTTSYHFNGSSQLLGDAIPSNTYHVFSQVYRSTGAGAPFHTLYMNGVNLNVAAAAAGYNVTGAMVIGNYSGLGNGFGGDLVELLVYNAALSDSDRQLVESYLAGRLAAAPPPAQLLARWTAEAGADMRGGGVSQWVSQTPGAQVLANASEPNTPVLAPNALACDRPAVRFDGNDQLNGDLGASLDSATIFTVARYADANSSNSYVYAIGNQGAAGAQMTLSRISGTLSYHYNGNSPFVGLPVPGQAWHVFSQVYHCSANGSSWQHLWVDGADRNVENALIPYFTTPNIVVGNFDSGTFHFEGDIHEIRIYNRAMTDAERQAVEAELTALLGPQADLNATAAVNVDDLLAVINAWGPCDSCPPVCYGDVNRNCVVNVDDLLAVINAWGACP